MSMREAHSKDIPIYVKLPLHSDTIYEGYVYNDKDDSDAVSFLFRHTKDMSSIVVTVHLTSLLKAIKTIKGLE